MEPQIETKHFTSLPIIDNNITDISQTFLNGVGWQPDSISTG